MSDTNIMLKANDTAPGPRVRLVGGDGAAVDLTGATVEMMVVGGTALACDVVNPPSDGIVRVPRGSLAPEEGKTTVVLRCEFQVTFSGGEIQTFPEEGYQLLQVWDDLDE